MRKYVFLISLIAVFAIVLASNATLWDFYKSYLPSVSERAIDAQNCGIDDYSGTYEQNIVLERCLLSGGYLEVDVGNLGGTLPVAGTTYNLAGGGISSSAASITLQSLTLPQTGQLLSDSDFSSTFYITVEPGNKTRQEIVSCTTVTQNSGGTATLSGCSRGMSPITPYTASSTLQFSHAGGAQVIFSDPPQLFNEFGALLNNNIWSKLNTFATSTGDSTDDGYIQFSTSTASFIKNISGVLYYCNNGVSCAAIGAGANTYNFVGALTTSGSEVKVATSTDWGWSAQSFSKISAQGDAGTYIDFPSATLMKTYVGGGDPLITGGSDYIYFNPLYVDKNFYIYGNENETPLFVIDGGKKAMGIATTTFDTYDSKFVIATSTTITGNATTTGALYVTGDLTPLTGSYISSSFDANDDQYHQITIPTGTHRIVVNVCDSPVGTDAGHRGQTTIAPYGEGQTYAKAIAFYSDVGQNFSASTTAENLVQVSYPNADDDDCGNEVEIYFYRY